MADASVTSKATVKKIKKSCRQCGKTRNLTKTECCDNWICEDKYSKRYGDYGCHKDHRKYSCCYYHYVIENHKCKLEDCEECMKMGLMDNDFEDVTCISCGFKSQTMEDFAFQLNDDFYCTKDECKAKVKRPPSKSPNLKVEAKDDCQAKGKPPPSQSTKKKVQIKKVSKVVARKVKKACRSCGMTSKLIKTKCCNNWVCKQENPFRLFPFGFNRSCFVNHHKYSCCTLHFNEKHEGKWRDCTWCKEENETNGELFDFKEVTCVSCGFKSETMEDFAFQIDEDFYEKDFYCKKDECQEEAKPTPVKRTKNKSVVKKESTVVVQKIKKACRSCGKNRKLTKTECCDNWICDDEHKYRLFSFALNSCHRNHRRYSNCGFHHTENHEGKWKDCGECKEEDNMNGEDFDFDEVTCVSCGLKSDTLDNFAFKINDDFYCTKVECQKKGKTPPSKNTKRKAEVEEVSTVGVKKAKRAPLTITSFFSNKN